MFKNYVNICNYAGWADYFDEEGIKWRRKDEPSWYDFYKIIDGDEVHEGSMPKGLRHYCLEDLHKKFLKMMESIRDSGWC